MKARQQYRTRGIMSHTRTQQSTSSGAWSRALAGRERAGEGGGGGAGLKC